MECLKAIDDNREGDRNGGDIKDSCGMCGLPICSDQFQVVFILIAGVLL